MRPFVVALVGALLLTSGSASADGPALPAPSVLQAPPWLGVSMDPGTDLGVAVTHVIRSSPADRAGLRAGDRIVSLDGQPTLTADAVTSTVRSHRTGDTLVLGYERGGLALTASVVLAARPGGDDMLRMDLVGAPSPAWVNVTPLSGAPAALADLKGRVVLMDFWASWCGPCLMAVPRLSALRDRFAAQGLTVIGITTDEAERAAVFAERHQMHYGNVVDKAGDTTKAYGVVGLPTMVLVDKRGVAREVFVGFDPGNDVKMEALIKSLLAEQGPLPAVPAPAPTAPARPGAR